MAAEGTGDEKIMGGERKEASNVRQRKEGRERAEEEEVQSVCCAYTPWHPTADEMEL